MKQATFCNGSVLWLLGSFHRFVFQIQIGIKWIFTWSVALNKVYDYLCIRDPNSYNSLTSILPSYSLWPFWTPLPTYLHLLQIHWPRLHHLSHLRTLSLSLSFFILTTTIVNPLTNTTHSPILSLLKAPSVSLSFPISASFSPD